MNLEFYFQDNNPATEEKDKYIHYPVSNNFTNELYDIEYAASMENKEEFWAKQADELIWIKKPTTIVDESD